jgi:hypothetical protein
MSRSQAFWKRSLTAGRGGGKLSSGTEALRCSRRLGAGGMVVVYEAQDVARGEIDALKTLHHVTPWRRSTG